MIHSYLVWFLWWLRHGAIGPSEATLFRVNVDWPDFRINTFELVIRLSKVQQSAFRFCTFLWSPASPAVPWDPLWFAYFKEWSRAEHSETSFLLMQLLSWQWHYNMHKEPGRHTTFRCGVFSFWLSGGVKHIVHLIRWNLKAVYANWGKTWPRSRKGNNARLLGS